MDKEIFGGIILLAVAAICAIATIVLIVVTPFLPDEVVVILAGLISGIGGIFKIRKGRSKA